MHLESSLSTKGSEKRSMSTKSLKTVSKNKKISIHLTLAHIERKLFKEMSNKRIPVAGKDLVNKDQNLLDKVMKIASAIKIEEPDQINIMVRSF